VLEETVRRLSLQRMNASLLPGEERQSPDTQASARIFELKLGIY